MNEMKEKLEAMGKSILSMSRNELYVSMRFFDIALASLDYKMNLATKTLGTDGVSVLFNPRHLADLYRMDKVLVNRAYMHMLIHNMFCHDHNYKNRNARSWNLACDIAAESLIDSMDVASVRITVSDYRTYIYKKLQEQMHVLTAEGIYKYLNEHFISGREFDRMCRAFLVDDHRFWEHEEKEMPQNQQQTPDWQQIARKIQTNMQTFSKDFGDAAGDLSALLDFEYREKYHYREFLKQFAAWGEEIIPDDDSFDYAFYTFGMDYYGNMPLIEPLEYKDVKKIDEFVIAIDTSESCPPETVKLFLEQTYGMLSLRESFFKKVNIHIVQCDAGIASDTVITDSEAMSRYIADYEVRGFGGTDFRPVFDYTDQLIAEGVLSHLKGLIYFTDGYGEFPERKPDYESAFIFMTEEYSDRNVPPWAVKLILTPQELEDEANEYITGKGND